MLASLSSIHNTLGRIVAVTRRKPFDTSTPEGRSSERFRRVVLSSAATVSARGLTFVTVVASVPLTLRYLGPERYGMWMTISATVAALAFADLGMGTGLMNAISSASGKDDRETIKQSVSSAFFLLSGVAAILLIALAAVYPFIPWAGLFNVRSALARAEAGPAVMVFAVCFVLSIPLGVVQRVQMGFQEGYESNVWQSAGNVLGLLAVIAAIWQGAGLPYLVLGMSGGPVVAAAANCVVQFGIKRPWLRPSPSTARWSVGRGLMSSGLCFMLLTLLNMLGTQSDSLVIAQLLGASSAVAIYAVVVRLFYATSVFEMFIAPFWPAFGEAVARGDYAWASRTLNRLIPFGLLLAMLLSVPLVLFGKPIVALWAGKNMVPPIGLLLSFAAWSLVVSYRGIMSAFLNNEQFLRKQVWFFGAASVLAFALKFPFVLWWDQAGAVWASVVAYGALYAWPARVVASRDLVRLQRQGALTIVEKKPLVPMADPPEEGR